MVKAFTLTAALLLGACSQGAPPSAESAVSSAAPSSIAAAAPAPKGPPLIDGFYAAKGACPFEGCQLQNWKTLAKTDLHGAPKISAPIAATLPAGEWVRASESVALLKPEHGIAAADSGMLKAGDEIWRLDGQGEGAFTVWRRGEMLDWTDDGSRDESDPRVIANVRWDHTFDELAASAEADKAAGAGWWVRVQRANGQSGWVRPEQNFDCTGVIDQSQECAAKNASPR